MLDAKYIPKNLFSSDRNNIEYELNRISVNVVISEAKL